jgi:hypothetical protein
MRYAKRRMRGWTWASTARGWCRSSSRRRRAESSAWKSWEESTSTASDARDGQLYYYDVNALSNFVADAPNVIGFDPFVRLADYLEAEAAAAVTTRAEREAA